MKKRLLSAICAAALIPPLPAFGGTSPGGGRQDKGVAFGGLAADAGRQDSVIAFVGAEGGGMYTQGARAAESIEVYHVTNLNDSGEGSFRDAVSKGDRIVVFDVSGYIDLATNVSIAHDNITVLGQTAPGAGICFRSNNIKVSADNVILRYLRFRVGAHDANGNDTRAQDGLEITDNCEKVIIDHCSVSWGTDENLSAYAVKDVTIQNSIIAEALNQSVHDKGEHSYAAIWGGVNLSVHHNLIATHKSRNPKIGTSETVAMTAGYTDAETLADIHNNIIYNWGDKAGYGSENGAHTYIQNNIYRPGPATPAGKRARIFELSVGQKYETNMLGSVYAAGNIIDIDADDPDYKNAQLVNENNYQDASHCGVYVDNKVYGIADSTDSFMTEPDEAYNEYAAEYPYELEAADNALYNSILQNAGATLPRRDATDARIIENVRSRTAPTGSKGSTGLLDDPTDAAEDGYDGRGYCPLDEEVRDNDFDKDRDGISDTWESRMGLDPSNPTDSVTIGPDGYTWLEIYIETALTNPTNGGGLAVSADEALNTTKDSITLTAAYGDAAYKDGIVTVPDGTKGTAIVCGYNNGLIKDIKTAAFDGSQTEAEVGTVDGDIRIFLWNSLDGMVPLQSNEAVSSVVFYCNDKPLGTAANGALTTTLPSGDNVITAKAYMADGSYILSPVKHISINGADTPAEWASEGAAYDGEYYTLPNGSSLSQTADGDFKLVTKLDSITSRFAGTETGLFCGELKLYKTYDDSFKPIIGCSQLDTTINGGDIRYLEISRSGGKVTVYAGKSLADLENAPLGSFDISGRVEAGAYVSGDNTTVSKLSMLQLATEQTSPKAALQLDNVGRLIMNGDLVDIEITPDNGIPVIEVWLYLGDTAIASKEVYITQKETVSLPFSAAAAGFNNITVYCFDAQLGRGTDSRAVSVSQEISPWMLTDLGTSENTYVSVTPDYTYKIGSGKDSIAYVNQLFNTDMRMYYRSRMQNSDRFGVLLKGNGNEVFFGGVKENGAYIYKLTANGKTEAVADIGGSQNQYFVAEKSGGTVNIYKTENGSTVYKTKQLIATTDSELGDEYYMGFVAEGGEPDSGWVSLEAFNESTVAWSFDSGLDWRWQIQETNVLSPVWTDENVVGNLSGKMKLAPNSDYSSERYVLHEYLVPEGNNVITASADVLMSGEQPGMNIYLSTGRTDEAYKVSLAEDGYIHICGENSGIAYDTMRWYTVSVMADLGAGNEADILIKDSDGKPVADVPGVSPIHFRSQLDTKKVEITNGVFFEPISAASGVYYIDNVYVDVTPSKIQKNVLASHFWRFSDESFDGLTKINSGTESAVTAADATSNSKTIAGISFTKRYSLNQNGSTTNRCVKLSIPAGITDVTVYAASANSSQTRTLVVNDGEAHETGLTSAGAAVSYHYDTTEPQTIYVYGLQGINLYGISYETYEYVTAE